MSKSIELICGAKAPRGSNSRVPHALRKPAMQPGPVTVIKFTKSETPGLRGSISEMSYEAGARDPEDVLVSAGLLEDPNVEDDMDDGTFMGAY